jgi:hypothetical protein
VIPGVNLYVVAAVGLAFLGLGGYGAYQYQRAEAGQARAESAESLAAQYRQDLAESEADKAALREDQRRLDAAIRARDLRLALLERAKRNLSDEYDRIKKTLGEADQSCLDRGLPDAFVERLRNESVDGDKDGKTGSSRSPAIPVPDLIPPG